MVASAGGGAGGRAATLPFFWLLIAKTSVEGLLLGGGAIDVAPVAGPASAGDAAVGFTADRSSWRYCESLTAPNVTIAATAAPINRPMCSWRRIAARCRCMGTRTPLAMDSTLTGKGILASRFSFFAEGKED